MGTTPKQCLFYLPDELLLQPRFFRVGRDEGGVFNHKIPIDKWNNPANQRRYNKLHFTDERQMAGFDIVGHGNAQDYLVLDFDHVLNDEGQFVTDAAQKWYNYIALSGTYIEKSISGHGLHAIFKPSDGEFNKMASGSNARLDLGFESCIEIFYKPNGRYFLLTGDVYECEPKTPISTDCDVVHSLIDEITKSANDCDIIPDEQITDAQIESSTPYSDNPPEYESARQLAMLNAINPNDLLDNDWLAVISACKNLGISEKVVDDWNRRDKTLNSKGEKRYNKRKNKIRYDSLKAPSFDIPTLHGIAKRFGYSEGDFKRTWYRDNPQFSNARVKEYSKKAGRDYIPLDFFNTIEKQIDESKEKAKTCIASISDYTAEIANYEVLFSMAILQDCHDSDAITLYNNFYQQCKKEQVDIRRLKETIKYCSEKVKDSLNNVKRLKFQSIADFKVAISGNNNIVYPAGYEVDDSGIRNAEYKKIANAPIRITALYYRDSDNTRVVDIWTRDTNGMELVIDRVDKDVISDAKKITALSARGLAVTSTTAKLLVDYLNDYIDYNKENLIPQKLLTKMGWYADDLFVTPYDARFKFDSLGNFADSLQQKGSFSDWKALAREVMQYPVARFTLAACLAPPLLRILGERTFSIYLMCDSKAGKSAVAKFGGSCWGNEGVVRNLRSTINGLEGELAECTDFPFIADEKQLAEKMNMSQLAYLIAQGQGKGRMTKDGKSKKRRQWRTIGILSGEEIITDDISTQGAITRTLQIIVTDKTIIPKDLAKKIYHSIQKNYGYAGQCFIDNLLKENFDELRELKDYFQTEIEDDIFADNLIDDYTRYIALISVADSLMQRYFFDVTAEAADKNALVNAYAITEMIQSEKELSDATREWTLISGWIAENRGLILNNPNIKFVDDNGDIHMPAQNKIIGVYEDNSIFILVSALKDYCKRQGLNYSKVIRDLDEAGYIVRGKDRPTQCKRIEGSVTRVVQFNFHEETFN